MDDKEKNLAQNEPVKPVEAPQEAEKAQEPSEGGTSVDAAQEPTSVPTEAVLAGQNTEKRLGTDRILAIIVVAALVLCAGVFWWFMAGPGRTMGRKIDVGEGKTEIVDEVEIAEKEEIDDNPENDSLVTEPEMSEVEIRGLVTQIVWRIDSRVEQLLEANGVPDAGAQLMRWISRDGSSGLPKMVTSLGIVYVRPDGSDTDVEAIKTAGRAFSCDDGRWDSAFEKAGLVESVEALLIEEGFQFYESDKAGDDLSLFYNPDTGIYCSHGPVGLTQFGTMFNYSCAHKTWATKN